MCFASKAVVYDTDRLFIIGMCWLLTNHQAGKDSALLVNLYHDRSEQHDEIAPVRVLVGNNWFYEVTSSNHSDHATQEVVSRLASRQIF
jgi:hypothetical protein